MERYIGIVLQGFIVSVFFVTSCATINIGSNLKSSWKDNEYREKIKSVLIIGMARKTRVRKSFESEFTEQLKKRGIKAVAGHQYLESTRKIDKETIVSTVNELQVDTVLITKVIDKQYVSKYTTEFGAQSRMHNYYSVSETQVYSTGETNDQEVVVLETSLFDAKSEKLIWRAVSETFIIDYYDYNSETKSFIKLMMRNLSDNQLI